MQNIKSQITKSSIPCCQWKLQITRHKISRWGWSGDEHSCHLVITNHKSNNILGGGGHGNPCNNLGRCRVENIELDSLLGKFSSWIWFRNNLSSIVGVKLDPWISLEISSIWTWPRTKIWNVHCANLVIKSLAWDKIGYQIITGFRIYFSLLDLDFDALMFQHFPRSSHLLWAPGTVGAERRCSWRFSFFHVS